LEGRRKADIRLMKRRREKEEEEEEEEEEEGRVRQYVS
jgi:hypothetical protein